MLPEGQKQHIDKLINTYNRSIDNRWSPAVPKKVSRDLLTPPDPASNTT